MGIFAHYFETVIIMNIEKEKKTIAVMIQMYCKSKHQTISLCDDCKELLNYANKKLDYCKWKENKPTCKKCPTHCYKPDMKKKIKKVMRYSGPRLLLKHPILLIKHVLK